MVEDVVVFVWVGDGEVDVVDLGLGEFVFFKEVGDVLYLVIDYSGGVGLGVGGILVEVIGNWGIVGLDVVSF